MTTVAGWTAGHAAGKQFDPAKKWRQSLPVVGQQWAKADGNAVAPTAPKAWTFGL